MLCFLLRFGTQYFQTFIELLLFDWDNNCLSPVESTLNIIMKSLVESTLNRIMKAGKSHELTFTRGKISTKTSSLTHHGLVTPYADIDFGDHWL